MLTSNSDARGVKEKGGYCEHNLLLLNSLVLHS